jgi:hypothetical protein
MLPYQNNITEVMLHFEASVTDLSPVGLSVHDRLTSELLRFL